MLIIRNVNCFVQLIEIILKFHYSTGGHIYFYTPNGKTNSKIDHHLTVSRKGLDQIIAFEISSVSYYKKHLKHPIWPGGASGITIGIGYDLGYHSRSRIKKDWGGKIPDADLETLLTVSGKKGEAAKEALPDVQHIEIPIQTAKEVFYTCTLPTFAALTRKAYPGVEKLPADAQAMLLSLIYNRGSRMSGTGREEMRNIRDLVTAEDLDAIADQTRAMKRLWDSSALPGLHTRRDKEAEIIASANRNYEPSELVSV
jgi:GH24 family phage-related lysozyme (muramidase)